MREAEGGRGRQRGVERNRGEREGREMGEAEGGREE